MADPDDDALSWAGDEAPVAEGLEARVELVEPAEARPQLPAALLVTYGIIAGAYLIYTFGWVVSIQRYLASFVVATDPLDAFMFGAGEVLAILAPALWLAGAFVLTRGRRAIIRLAALLLGLVVVVPWPFVLGVWQ